MKKVSVLSVFCVLILIASGVSSTEDTSPAHTITKKTTTSTTEEPTTTTTTEIPTTSTTTTTTEIPTTSTTTTEKPTTSKTTTTTQKSTTTKITTTTEKPTTSKTTTTTQKSTTTKITTTTEKPTTTTIAPPTPEPAVPGVWNVTSSSGGACIVMKAKINLDIVYETVDAKNKSITHQNISHIFVPNSAKNSGNCGKSLQQLELKWQNGTSNLSLTFFFENKTSTFTLAKILSNISVSDILFPGLEINETSIVSIASLVNSSDPVPMNQSYRCHIGVSFNMNNTFTTKRRSTINMSDLHFEAFANTTNNKFDIEKVCAGDATNGVSDWVPIVVGLALIGLVVIVLVAYVIGRRSPSIQGYLSM